MKIRKYSAADDALIGREVRTYSWTLMYMSIEKWSTIAIEKWSIYSLVLSHEIVSSKRWLVGLDMSKI